MGNQKDRITKAKISLRVSVHDWANPTCRQELLDYLRNHPGTLDEVWLFTILTAAPLPLAKIYELSDQLAEVLPQFKALGLAAGINHLATVGHYDENLENSLTEPWQHLVDISGATSSGCYCASDPRVQEYVRQSYAALAKSRPDFILFDDDLRLEPHGNQVQYPCFCDGCLARFSQETGRTWTRASLREGFRSGTLEERLALRRQWLQHNRQYQSDLLGFMRAGVDSVNPNLTLGFMSVEGSYSAYGMAEWAAALAGSNLLPVMCRPGGGIYDDHAPTEILSKAHWTGRQVAFLPPEVVDIQYEHENYPYQMLKKSRTIFTDEIGLGIAIGCTGAALNLMGLTPDPIGEFLPYLDAVRTNRKFFDRAAAAFGRSANQGFWPGFSMDHSAALNPREDWFKTPLWGVDFAQFTELAEIGLPMAYAPEGATLTVLNATSVLDLPRPALLKSLSSGVMLDGPALEELERLGLGEFTGFKVSGTRDQDAIEVFSQDAINGQFAGWQRDCRPATASGNSYLLQAAPGARPLAELVDFNQASLGTCAGVFENRLGGRVAVMGYYAWNWLQSLAKSAQIKALFRWLSRDRLPAYIDSYTRTGLWCRRDAGGRPAFLLVNASLDSADEMVLRALTDGARLTLVRTDGRQEHLPAAGRDGAYNRYALPHLKPWEMVLLVTA